VKTQFLFDNLYDVAKFVISNSNMLLNWIT